MIEGASTESLVRRLQSSYNCPSFNNCPEPCIDGEACDCRYPEGANADKNCLVCHSPYTGGPGCDQCDTPNDYFKVDYNYTCAQCQEVFGAECLHCGDFDGCQQCADGYDRIFDPDCHVYWCRPPCQDTRMFTIHFFLSFRVLFSFFVLFVCFRLFLFLFYLFF